MITKFGNQLTEHFCNKVALDFDILIGNGHIGVKLDIFELNTTGTEFTELDIEIAGAYVGSVVGIDVEFVVHFCFSFRFV
jgi:hypothetical protein